MTSTRIRITPAPDCPQNTAKAPPAKARIPRANMKYDLLTHTPHTLDHNAFTDAEQPAVDEASGKTALGFEAFHAKRQPRMRASPRTKRYGWAAKYDPAGKLALAADPGLPSKPAMRSTRGQPLTTIDRLKRCGVAGQAFWMRGAAPQTPRGI